MRERLQPGMTVQLADAARDTRVAYCVRCGWKSHPASFDHARKIATQPDSHPCPRAARSRRQPTT